MIKDSDNESIKIFLIVSFLIILNLSELFNYTNITGSIFKYSNCPVSKQFFMFFLLAAQLFFIPIFFNNYNKNNDIMIKKVGYVPVWQWSHIWQYFIYAFFCPNDWIFVAFISIFWETVEYLFSLLSDKLKYLTDDFIFNYSDVIANLMGYSAGILVNQIVMKIFLS